MQKKTLRDLEQSSYLAAGNSSYLEVIYDQYLKDPMSVDQEWRSYFDTLPNVGDFAGKDISELDMEQRFLDLAHAPIASGEVNCQQEAVDALIVSFRLYGHHEAKLDPLNHVDVESEQRLQLAYHGLSDGDLSTQFNTRGVLPQATASLSDIFKRLQALYCGTVGFEFMHVSNQAEQDWLRETIEGKFNHAIDDKARQIRVLNSLTSAEGLEHFLDVKYPGQKRFSIEGLDTLIPLLNELTINAARAEINELVMSMAHRGRLNVCVNAVGKPPKMLFEEYAGKHDYGMTTGDVKYHLGYSADIKTHEGVVHSSLLFNPSHLDYICPVQLGSVRGRQDRYANGKPKHQYALGVMMHGDAAFSTQGVNAEVFAMSQVRAYNTGGTVHIVTNNQIGYTTSNLEDARSSRYCTDMAKIIESPVIHVNADDPEAAINVMDLAFSYRQKFGKDVVIDLVGYRRYGHQEVDEPRATQPVMYQIIRAHKSTCALYAEKLVQQGVVTEAEVKAKSEAYRDRLDKGLGVVETVHEGIEDVHKANWTPYLNNDWQLAVDTTIAKKEVKKLSKAITTYPEGFTLLRQVDGLMKARKKMANGEQAMDWGFAETMAYASLVDSGVPVRFSGEDVRRGTFFHRHATLFDQKTGEEYTPLDHISDDQAPFDIYDSVLSELGPMGFEYGYSTARPGALVIWEAQFGDFANTAQVMVDQFISSAWHKWKRLSGLVLLLPHGYEGMGPEHSSARLERYLQLCAQNNMQVCVPTTPSQIFHLLRRQELRPYRKPLVVMTPKSLLRHKLAVSPLDDLSSGQFHLVIPEIEPEVIKPKDVKRIVLCSGKVYYDLLEKRREKKQTNVAIIRIEQLYPFPYDDVEEIFAQYPNAKSIMWCQEEPRNQGAWYITRHRLVRCMDDHHELDFSTRPAMAAPAAGYPALNKQQQEELVDHALDIK
ncbi:MAG: 2-oxoglutarate dehydrogenase E1 component [Coxiellaceae bacterium]|nr:2-oxoglutarate dehydrogenase E1 component [Coxiellaceae bacterium]